MTENDERDELFCEGRHGAGSSTPSGGVGQAPPLLTFRIRDWEKNFEKAQTKRVNRLSWVALPNKHDGKSFKRLMRMNPAHYLAWVLLVQVASKCPTRGVLADVDGPLTPADLEIKTECPASVFEKAIPVLCSSEIGWLETVEPNHTRSALGAHSENAHSDYEHGGATGQDRQDKHSLPTAEARDAREELGQTPKTANVWKAWVDVNRARGRLDPATVGPDTKAGKELGAVIPPERLAEILAEFLDDPDPFLHRQGHALRHLPGRVNAYLNGGTAAGDIMEEAAARVSRGIRAKKGGVA